jgi:hypothetical protein
MPAKHMYIGNVLSKCKLYKKNYKYRKISCVMNNFINTQSVLLCNLGNQILLYIN